MNALAQIARFLAKRPSDAAIRSFRVLFGLALAAALLAARGNYRLLPEGAAAYESAAQWALLALAVPPFFAGATGWCFMKKSNCRKAQFAMAVFLFVLGGWLMRPLAAAETAKAPEAPKPAVSSEATPVSFADAARRAAPETAAKPAEAAAPANPGAWVALLAWLPLLAGITGKGVTSNCLRYGEVVTKIRV